MASLVHRRGYAAAGVEDVCRAAGVKKGSFYHFFSSKTALMLAAMDWQAQRGGELLFGPVVGSPGTPASRLAKVLVSLGELEARNVRTQGAVLGCPFGNLIAEVAGHEPQLLERADEGLRRMGQSLQIEPRAASGKAATPTSRRREADEADALVAFFEGVTLLAKARNDPAVFSRLAPLALRFSGATATGRAKRRRRSRRAPRAAR